MNEVAPTTQAETFGRYLLYPAIARGGMATVHTARLVGAEGFSRLVAAKRLHPQFTDDPEFITMFHDEACIASRIHHPNVVPVLDVVVSGDELILVQEYVHGVPLGHLMKVAQQDESPIAIDVAIGVLVGVLAGLHAAHEAKDEADTPLEIVHRDVSPANVMISVAGVPRLLDFGIAKARTSTHHTREGVFKGKLAYMAPEQIRMEAIDRRADIYSIGVLAWELLVNRRIYGGRHDVAFVAASLRGELPSLEEALVSRRGAMGEERWRSIVALAPVVSRAMSLNHEDRYATALDMVCAILDVHRAATTMTLAEWVRTAGAEFLLQRQRILAANEESWRRTSLSIPTPCSGMQRAVSVAGFSDVLGSPSAPSSVPSGLAVIGMSGRSSAPPSSSMSAATSVTLPAAPPTESGEYRVALGMSPLARVGARVRASVFLPWLVAGSFIVAGMLGGLVRGVTAPAPGISASSPAASSSVTLPAFELPPVVAFPAAPPQVLPAAPAVVAAPTVIAAPAVAAAPTPPLASTSASRPVFHWPPPPRPATSGRPASSGTQPPAATSASGVAASTSARVDCNPPFFFEGAKKVFKPSCL